MSYSGAPTARAARERLSQALGALQSERDIPEEIIALAAEVASSVGALYEAEHAASEPEGRQKIKSAMGFLTQTLALLQATRVQHPGVDRATESIAAVMGTLYPLSVAPDPAPAAEPEPAPAAPKPQAAPRAAAPSPEPPRPAEPAKQPPPEPRGGAQPRAEGAQARSGVAYAPRDVPLEVPEKRGASVAVEANVGANTESNFYLGFSGQVADGGVFLATYEVLPRGTWTNLLVTLPGGYEFRCEAWVRFVRDPLDLSSGAEPGMGLQFEALPGDAEQLILRFIRKRPPLFFDE